MMLREDVAKKELTDFTEKMAMLLPPQREQILDEIDNLLCADTESDNEATLLKHEVYSNYTNIISDLVAEVEVQAHDLPMWVYGFLEIIFNFCAVSVVEDEQKAVSSYQVALRLEKFLICYLKLYLIKYYQKDVLHFRKTIKRFNHSSIKMADGRSVLTVLDAQIKGVTVSRRAAQKEFGKCYKGYKRVIKDGKEIIDTKNLDFHKFDNLDIDKLEPCYKQVKDCLAFCEKAFPDVVDNGFVDSFFNRIVSFLPDILSFIFAMVGIILFLLSR